MIKKIVYIGLLLLFIGIAMGIATSRTGLPTQSSVSPYIENESAAGLNSSSVNLKVGEDNFSFGIMNIYQNTSIYLVSVNASNYVNIYLFNGSGFKKWDNLISNSPNATGSADAGSLQKSGAVDLIYNTSSAKMTNLYYDANGTPTYKEIRPGSYYIVVDNTKGSVSSSKNITANVTYYVAPFSLETQLSQNLTTQTASIFSPVKLLSGIIVFIAIIVIIYGLIKSEKKPEDQQKTGTKQKRGIFASDEPRQEYIDLLYKNIEKRDNSTKAKTPKRKIRRKKRSSS